MPTPMTGHTARGGYANIGSRMTRVVSPRKDHENTHVSALRIVHAFAYIVLTLNLTPLPC